MNAAVVGAGPAGLMAAEVLAGGGARVTVYDHMPSPGRKLLMAGRGGLNLTHSEAPEALLGRYAPAPEALVRAIGAFPPERLIAWCHGLGQPTFVGSSGRVFPVAMKASPLLRAWLARLAALGVRFALRRRWTGFTEAGGLRLEGGEPAEAAAVVLACGGASWPRLGSDGLWVRALEGLRIAPLRPSNCGFRVAWSEHFLRRFAGAPLKRIALIHGSRRVRGEALTTAQGIEGGAVYALSGELREAIARDGLTTAHIDLRPDLAHGRLAGLLGGRRGGQSLSTFLRKTAGLSPVAVGLVQEALHAGSDPADIAGLIKAVPLVLLAPQGLDRAISAAGGLCWDELDGRLMVRRRPGVFAAGEMLDWEAPTGGYLLQAAFSTGAAAGAGALAWMAERPR